MAVPGDFAARIRAGRAYADLSREQLAEQLGMSAGYVKNVENGKGLKPLEARSLLEALPEITGLPRSFFLGDPAEQEDRLAQILKIVQEMQAETRRRYEALESRLGKVDPEVADEAIRILAEARMRGGRDIGRRYRSDALATDRLPESSTNG